MYGLVNRAFQRFLMETYGDDAWADVAREIGLRSEGFEPLLSYPDALTDRILQAASGRLGQPAGELLEDLGTFVVAHPSYEPARRLLRFGGADFVDFLHSLDALPDRARLALPGLDFPTLQVDAAPPDRVVLTCGSGLEGFSHVLCGVLRGIADDYGALATIDHVAEAGQGAARIIIEIHNSSFAAGRSFELAPVRP
jgi:hypothetical protein